MNTRILQCLMATSLLATSGLIYLTISVFIKLVAVNTPLQQTASAKNRQSLVQISKQMAVVTPQQLSKAKTYLVQNQEFLKSDVRKTDLSANQGKFVSVKDFGAIGNNIADDTKAIQQLMLCLKLAEGLSFFPEELTK